MLSEMKCRLMLRSLLLGHFTFNGKEIEYRWSAEVRLAELDPELHKELVEEYKTARLNLTTKGELDGD